MDKEIQILASWEQNAVNWIHLLDTNGIESRKLVTNQAILDAILVTKPVSVLDLGCGEGWLSEKLSKAGLDVSGIDAIPVLVKKAKSKAKGDFYTATYEAFSSGQFTLSKKFDAIVINFALIGKESTEHLLKVLPTYLNSGGKLFIQTLDPHSRKSLDDYNTGWKTGSWDGLGDQFTKPYEWYFRTLEDWLDIIKISGFKEIKTMYTTHPGSGQCLSVIFVCNL